MKKLLGKEFEDYKKVTDLSLSYQLGNGKVLKFSFEKEAFPHLIGLHKLIDIPLIARFNDPNEKMVGTKYLLGKIRQEKITEQDIKSSKYFKEIKDRYERFSAENLMSLVYADSIVDFNVTLLKKSRLYNTKYIFYEKPELVINEMFSCNDFYCFAGRRSKFIRK